MPPIQDFLTGDGNKYGVGIVISHSVQDKIVGKIMEIIEAAGLPPKQEVSIKNLIKEVIYKSIGDDFVPIDGALHDLIRDLNAKLGLIISLDDVKWNTK
jgi:hypothetical protein